jgi:hypothetical protein
MTTFGVDLSQHLAETGSQVPHLLAKCINEIDTRGIQIKVYYLFSFFGAGQLIRVPVNVKRLGLVCF